MRYFLYVRKSTESEDRQETSLDSQSKACHEFAEKGQLNIVREFVESMSAARPGRPIFNEMLNRIEAKEADGIICWKMNRLARNPLEIGRVQQLLQDGAIQEIVTVTEGTYKSGDNALMATVNFGVANQFSRDLSRDVKRGKMHRAKVLQKFMGHSKYGFIYHPKVKEAGKVLSDGKLELHPEHSKVIAKIYELAEKGNSISQIARWLYDHDIEKPAPDKVRRGIKRLGNTVWSRGTIQSILTNEMYAGTYWYGKSTSDNKKRIKNERKDWVPVPLGISIVSKDTFDNVQRNLRTRRRSTGSKRFYLIRGIGKCGYCGHSLVGTVSGNATPYYRCGSRWLDYTKPSSCPFRMVKAEYLDKAVIGKVQEIVNDPEAITNYAASQSQQTILNLDVTKEIAKLNTKLDRLADLYAEGDIDKDRYRRRKGTHELHLNYLQSMMFQNREPDHISAAAWAKAMKGRLKRASKEEMRQVIISMAEKISVKNQFMTVQLLCGDRSDNRRGDFDTSRS